ncbi:MAG: Stk1 family PASTA domain-containing Ser/Thr kinase [Acidobacteriota bacterium]|nr:Stk1 family PASTA domain-containing Ser/Thr kinase [Acidobacteriota bacterium]
MAGKVLGGRYTVQDRIGTGGMAIVYRGLDEVLGRTVAIKTMLPQYANDPSFAARFKQEAQAAAALSSPYIVSVYDWGKDEDAYYIVMEYLRGTDLKSGIRKHGALDSKKVAQIGSQIAQALSVAHRHEIIHRDIKPQNIMVLRDGNIKVMDFGIARAKNSHLTTDNSVLGTAHYVSPEQTQGKELGPTTDIYSLGIVMYEAATGKVPFEGDDAITVALKQVNEQPKPPSQINPNIDPSLESIILKCMQKDPAARFQTADELYHVLRDYMAGRLQAVNAVTSVMPVASGGSIGGSKTTPILPATDPASTGGRTSRSKPATATERALRQAEERERKARRRRTLTIVGFVAALAAIGVAVAMLLNNANSMRSVPNLLNYTQAEALKQIDESNGFFERGEVTSEYSPTVEEGKVISQNPDAGTKAKRGTKIDLVISKGEEPKETVEVPDLRNLEPSEAKAKLAEVGLKGESGDSVYDSEVEAGKIASQSPKAHEKAKEGDTVTYHLSKGKESVEVPSVVGESESAATEALEAKDFEVEVAYDYSNTYDKGIVMEQSKTGTAEKGSTIRIVVSLGRESIEVPSVVGYDQANATSTLQNAGFAVVVNTQESDTPAGQVISQSPTGSIAADADRTVTITVSTGRPADDPDSGGDGGGASTP